MKILVIGSGGREHAIAWKCRQSSLVQEVYVAPGNAGTAMEKGITNVPIAAINVSELLQFANKHQVNLTIVGPETPLALGIVDIFNQAGHLCFGPTQKAARLESSKQFSKEFMHKYQIPTAKFASFNNLSAACEYAQSAAYPLVIKADGLAAGKGVSIVSCYPEAEVVLNQFLQKENDVVVIEEFIQGEELSFIAITDGKTILPLATSQDHKTRDNFDRGPNTGGMGAYSPAPLCDDALQDRILTEVMQPTIRGMAEEGIPYQGFLYAGLMITPQKQIKVLEFNCRLGDPETQVILLRLKSDLVATILDCLQGKLMHSKLDWDPHAALGVVLAQNGYPESYPKGIAMGNLPETQNFEKIFHAGTTIRENTLQTDGGRVLCVCALGDSIKSAQTLAYQLIDKIHWQGMFYRTDIGNKAIDRK